MPSILTISIFIIAIVTSTVIKLTDSVTCNYDNDGGFYTFIRTSPQVPSYICNLTTTNYGGYENQNEIRGATHGSGRSDYDVKIIQGYYPLKLKAFTPVFCQKFQNVEVIDMSYTEIEGINAAALQNCRNLKLLHFRFNKIQKIPDQLLSNNPRITNIWLNFNQLTTLPEQLLRQLSELKGLYLGNNQIYFLPNYVFYYQIKLQYLDLGNNRLQAINPNWFVNLKILKELSLDSNQISDLPTRGFQYLGNLQSLLLQNNRIRYLQPGCFEGLGSLTRLILGNNELYDLPGGIFAPLRSIHDLWLNNNKLTIIHGDSFSVHSQLTTIYFANNKISAIDGKLIDITAVSKLNMLDNVCYQDEILDRTRMKAFLGRCIENYRPRLSHTDTCGRQVTGHGNIIGGKQVSRGAFPWHVALVSQDGTFFCGGTLVSDQKVVTAAHCMNGKGSRVTLLPRDIIVLVGVHDLDQRFEIGRIPVPVQSVHVHPDWNAGVEAFDADIAVLILAEKVQFSKYIQPICLIDPSSFLKTINFGYVIGHGKSEDPTKIHENIPKVLTMPIHRNDACFLKNIYLTRISSKRTFCGGRGNGEGVCRGDSGSGLFVNYGSTFYLRGIVSSSLFTGSNECDVNTYSVFTDMLHYNDWVNSITPIGQLYSPISRRRRY